MERQVNLNILKRKVSGEQTRRRCLVHSKLLVYCAVMFFSRLVLPDLPEAPSINPLLASSRAQAGHSWLGGLCIRSSGTQGLCGGHWAVESWG